MTLRFWRREQIDAAEQAAARSEAERDEVSRLVRDVIKRGESNNFVAALNKAIRREA